MSDVVSFAELAGQHVELLPGRTLLQTSGVIYDTQSGVFVTDLDGDGGVDKSDIALASDDPDKTITREAPSIVTPA
ncbi:MAG: hypothetical protein ACRDTC_24235 [Pseudonocardiaceae bacterium]